jgi:hypothetical protein
MFTFFFQQAQLDSRQPYLKTLFLLYRLTTHLLPENHP